jgi:gliding motility-associated-like protein
MMKKYIRKTIQIILGISMLLFLLPIHVQGQCLNLDFSMNSFTNWQPYDGSCYGMYINISQSAVIPGKHTIMNAAQLILNNNIMDEQCRYIKKVPDGFNYSVKLGNSGTGAEMEALEYTMDVDSSNSLLILHFAWVMENPGHTPEEQPRFSMIIKDSLGKKLPSIPCGDVNFIASANLTNLVCNTIDMVARNWTTVGFNLETLIGQKIKIYFETRDCTQSGHFGYAYMVGECRPMAISVMHCNQDTAYLSAPDGFVQYRWRRSSHPTWIKEGSKELYQNILIDDPVDGEEFTCALVSELGDECRANLRVTIPVKTIINADFLYGIMSNGNVDTTGHNSVSWYDTCARKATFVDLSTVENSTKASILWEIPSLNAISADSLFTYTFPPTDTIVKYLVRLTVTAESGCVHSTERYITIYPLPVVDNMEDLVFCHGTKQIVNFTGIDMNINISEWTNSDTTIGFAASGTGNISFIANNTGTSPSTATITITPKNDSPQCSGHLKSFTITVNPLPVVNNIENSIICAGEKQIINFTGTNIDVYNSTWTNSDTTIGLDANGNGNISFTATNTGTMPLLSVITITPVSNKGCVAASEFFAIIVNPLPVMDTIEDIVICAGEKQIIHFTGTNIDLDSSMWINFNPAIGLDTMGNGNISFTATDTGTSSLISAIVMTPKSSYGCVGEMKYVVITVMPTPVMDTIENIVLCAEENRTIYFTGKNINLDSTIWTNSDTAIGLPADGIGNISFTATNNTTIPFISTVTVTLKSNEGCVGKSELFTIIVNPLPVMDSIKDIVICAGAEQSFYFIGTNIDLDSSMWKNVNPDIGLGKNGNGNISFTVTDTGTSLLISTITMTPKSIDGCVGEMKSAIITVKPTPVMDSVKNIVLCAGENQIINITGKNINLDSTVWTNNNPAIGLPANGIGNISFTATNNTTLPFISTITVTPKSNEGCVGESEIFAVIVNSLPVMDSIGDIVVCAGAEQNIHFSGTNIDLDSSIWTNVNTDIGLGKNGIGHISFTATDTVTSSFISSVRMIPKSFGGCVGEVKTFTITINPLPVMDDVNDIVLCPGEPQAIYFTNKNFYLDSSTWTNSNTAIGLGANGRGHISFTATNNTTLPFISTVTVTPKSNEGCVAASKIFTVTVNSLSVMDSIEDIVLCAEEEKTIYFTGTNIYLDSSIWTNVNTDIGLGKNGIGNISFTATNTVTSSLISSVRVIPKSAAGCVGEAKIFTITVHPLPVMADVNNIVICAKEKQTINFTGTNIDLDSSTWTNSNTAIGLGAKGKGNISFTTPDTVKSLIATITMTPKSSEGCVSESKIFTVTINPDIRILAEVNDSIFCEGSDIEFEILNADELTDINWSGPDNFSSSVSNPHITDISLDNAGMYYVNAITYCNREAISDSLLISVLPDVTLDMADTLFICHSEIVLSSNVKNATWYQWNTEEETEDITVFSPGKYWITATNPRCRAVDTIVVLEYNIHDFEIQTRDDICRDGSVNLYLEIEDENVFYNWSTEDTSNNITVYETGLYLVEISFMGCSSVKRIMIECPCEFWIPNVFTPNGDGLNDTFIPIPKTLLNTFSMYIWDRNGDLIFRTDTYTPWNGTNKEKNAAKGVYTYVIYYSCLTKPDKEFIIQGRITLER